jgi:hypothetical protein
MANMSVKEEVGPGGFWVQYTDSACTQLESLHDQTCTTVQEKLRVIAAVDPYAHGRTDPSIGHRDRRIVSIGEMLVTFWVSGDLKVLTVVNITPGEKPSSWVVPLGSPAGPGGVSEGAGV